MICMLLMFEYKSSTITGASSSSGEKQNVEAAMRIPAATTDEAAVRVPVATTDHASSSVSGVTVDDVVKMYSLSPEEDAALEFHPDDQTRYHVIFSTDCSPYQHWQSYLLYFSALKVKQMGHVHRIASGCTPEEERDIQLWFRDHVSKMSSRFHLHLTPHFSALADADADADTGKVNSRYKFFNKPFGLRHWMENSPLIQAKPDGSNESKDDIVILIDPDMALLRPITGDFSNARETLIGRRRQPKNKRPFDTMKVEHGKPFAQAYGLGSGWMKFNLDNIAGPDSPAKSVIREEAGLFYPVGPPYIATAADMHQIAIKWTEFAPKVHSEYPHLLAEMYAYCIAAAHLGLKHMLVDSLMISNLDVGGEGWPLVDKIPADQVCDVSKNDKGHEQTFAVPSVIHFCQRYALGKDWFFGKRRVPKDIFTCESPLLAEPPSNLATLFDWKQPPGQKNRKQINEKHAKREAFILCTLIGLTNEAATFYKLANDFCPAKSANLEKTMRMGAI